MATSLSNNLIGVLNLLSFLLSIPILSTGIYLSYHSVTECEKFLQTPLITIGVVLMAVSLSGLAGACCLKVWLFWFYLFATFLLILAAIAFTVFAFVVTSKGAGEAVSGRGYKEYRLGNYSHWLQNRVMDMDNWRKIKSCLQDAKVCRSLQEANRTMDEFYNENLSPTQSGCCKPPTECGFTYQNPITWDKPGNIRSTNPDCNTWQNDPTVLCYDCQSCKAGVIQNIKDDWKKVAIINIIFIFLLIIVYSAGCHAFRHVRRDSAWA